MSKIKVLLWWLLFSFVLYAGDDYEKIRADLVKIIADQKISRACLARSLDVSESTFRSFVTAKSKTSPTVKKAYESYLEQRIVQDNHEVLSNDDDNHNEFASSMDNFAGILIPVRGVSDDKDAKRVFFDHYVLQRASGYPSKVLNYPGTSFPFSALNDYMRSITYNLALFDEGSNFAPCASQEDFGLLFIPGRMRNKEYDQKRARHEKNLLRKALLRGQPVLGVCAGAWRVWQALLQIEEDPDYLHEVEEGLVNVFDHVASRMMSLSNTTGQVGYNTEIHWVKLKRGSLLSKVMRRTKQRKFLVNSVHWKAPDVNFIPANAEICARSSETPTEIKKRNGVTMVPQADIIEAFETRFGSLTFGIQWHPEAYNPGEKKGAKHLRILKYAADAGQAYSNKRKMLIEFDRVYGRTG